MVRDQQIRARVPQEIIDKIDSLVEYYGAISVGTVNKTSIVELAINELYQKVEQLKKTGSTAKGVRWYRLDLLANH